MPASDALRFARKHFIRRHLPWYLIAWSAALAAHTWMTSPYQTWVAYTPSLAVLVVGAVVVAARYGRPSLELVSDAEGFAVWGERGGLARRVSWNEVAATQVSVEREQRRHQPVVYRFTVTLKHGLPVEFTKSAQIPQLVELFNGGATHLRYEWLPEDADEGGRHVIDRIGRYAQVLREGRTPERAPAALRARLRDAVVSTERPDRGRTTLNRSIALAAGLALAYVFAPWDKRDTAAVIMALPAIFLVPLLAYAVWRDYGAPVYRLESAGHRLIIDRTSFGRERQVTVDWGQVTRTSYDMTEFWHFDDFVVEIEGHSPLHVASPADHPEVVEFFNERAPLPYEWIPKEQGDGRQILESNGPLVKVSK